jgi:hypothetical protein
MLLAEVFNRYKVYDLSKPSEAEIQKVDDPVQMAEILKKYSPTFVAAYVKSNYLLYRGVQDAYKMKPGSPIITGIRPNRIPVQMGVARAKILEKLFKSHGLTVTRQNAIFCSPKIGVTTAWGNAYIVFPKEPWTALVFKAKKYKSTYSFSDHQDIAIDILSRRADKSEIDKAFSEMKPVEFTSGNVSELIKSKDRHEVLITGDSYIGLPLKADFTINADFTKAVLAELKK